MVLDSDCFAHRSGTSVYVRAVHAADGRCSLAVSEKYVLVGVGLWTGDSILPWRPASKAPVTMACYRLIFIGADLPPRSSMELAVSQPPRESELPGVTAL